MRKSCRCGINPCPLRQPVHAGPRRRELRCFLPKPTRSPEQIREMVEPNVRLVPFVRIKYFKDAVPRHDEGELLAAGYEALVSAAHYYDDRRSTAAFATYATVAIIREMTRWMRDRWRSMKRERSMYMAPVLRPGVNSRRWVMDRTVDVEDEVELDTDLPPVNELLGLLDARRKDMVRRRVLNGETLTDIATSYGLTKERVRQLVEDSLDTMRDHLIKAGIYGQRSGRTAARKSLFAELNREDDAVRAWEDRFFE